MKKLIYLFFSCFFLFHCNILSAQFNPIIDSLARYINADSLARTVRDLENFGDRFATRDNKDVAEYLVQRLKSYGIDNAAIDSFRVTGSSFFTGEFDVNMYNVKGRISGSEQPDSVIIIGAHLDAISYNRYYQLYAQTPGADDNASGIAVMIEMARIIHFHNLTPNISIDFMAFDGEELGLIGSDYDARCRADSNENVLLMLNNDMVGYQPDTILWEVKLSWYDNSIDIVHKMREYCENYTAITPIIPDSANNNIAKYSDSYSYYLEGFKTVFSSENWFSPYYHTLNDSSTFLNYNYMADIARMNFAALFDFSRLQLPIDTSDTPIDTTLPSAISLPSALSHYSIYPNPATERATLQISVNEETAIQIVITDMTGRKIIEFPETTYASGNYNILINCSSLASGLYFCRIMEKNRVSTIKWIISKS
ncbi:MAG TPA: M28 family peptidase [Bacteroidales bacterium]|nr:M28 family peptidase [Bacteroidales bacterium]HOF46363.1 M28 family peptidase [Bacteroidales bacterium]HOS58000.1 M28 family peptidase [Bacteroidales bacterium]HRR03653.1 M28 family peptidase [Bacteroidales bacterium]HRT14282.1 M28 family peptidase [Bacteroidales bacterium]